MYVPNFPDFEKDVCTNNEHLIAKVYKLLLTMNQEDEYIKYCMIKWAKHLGV